MLTFLLYAAVVRYVAGQPPNDSCATPELIQPQYQVDPVAVATTQEASTFEFPLCGTGGNRDSPVVFYQFQGTGARLRISTCAAETDFNTAVVLEQDGRTCEDNIFCGSPSFNQDFDCDPGGRAVFAEIFSQEDQAYQLAIQGRLSTDVGTFGLQLLEYIRPTNDECSAAQLVTPTIQADPVVVATTVNATLTNFPVCSSGGNRESPVVFYQFQGTGARLRISTCASETDFNTAVVLEPDGKTCEDSIFCGSPSFNQDFDCDPEGRAVTSEILSVFGQTYQLAIQGRLSTDVGTFGLQLLEYIRPTNDECSAAQLITPTIQADPVVVATTVNATLTNFPVCSSGGNRESPVVFYQFQGTGARLRISTCASETDFNTAVVLEPDGKTCEDSIFCGSPSFNQDFDCDPEGRAVTSEILSVFGQTYLIAVQGRLSTDTGTFGLVLQDLSQGSSNDTVTTQTIAPDVAVIPSTDIPTGDPTLEPATITNSTPTGSPTLEPSATMNSTPTMDPTFEPAATTDSPSNVTFSSPTKIPTQNPTIAPLTSQSQAPSSKPTNISNASDGKILSWMIALPVMALVFCLW